MQVARANLLQSENLALWESAGRGAHLEDPKFSHYSSACTTLSSICGLTQHQSIVAACLRLVEHHVGSKTAGCVLFVSGALWTSSPAKMCLFRSSPLVSSSQTCFYRSQCDSGKRTRLNWMATPCIGLRKRRNSALTDDQLLQLNCFFLCSRDRTDDEKD